MFVCKFFFFILFLINIDCIYSLFYGNDAKSAFLNGTYEVLDKIINLIQYKISNLTLNISDTCKEALDKTFLNHYNENMNETERNISRYFYMKIFMDSCKTLNDISTYEYCMNRTYSYSELIKKHSLPEPVFLSAFVDNRKNIYTLMKNESYQSFFVLGLCFVDGCNMTEYKNIIREFINHIDFLNIDFFNNSIFNLLKLDKSDLKPNSKNSNSNIDNNYDNKKKFIDINDNNNEYDDTKSESKLIVFLKMIPLFIIVIRILFVLIKSIPTVIIKIFTCTLSENKKKLIRKTESNKGNQRNTLNSKTNKTKNYIKIVSLLYDIDKNYENLYSPSSPSLLDNDSGLSYITGLRGLSMLFLIPGFFFLILVNSPLSFINQNFIGKYIYNFLYKNSYDNFIYRIFVNIIGSFILYFGIRIAPRSLLACSGHILAFKFICFLDERKDVEKERKKEIEKKKSNNMINDNLNNINNENNGIEIKSKRNSEENSIQNDILNGAFLKKESETYSTCPEAKLRESSFVPFKFYLIFLSYQLNKYFIFLIFLFFSLFSLFAINFRIKGTNPMWFYFSEKVAKPGANITNILLALFGIKDDFYKGNKDNLINYFYLVLQEISYFIITSLIIFIGYKNNLRINKIFITMIFLLFGYKVAYYNLFCKLNNKYYFDFLGYGQFFTSFIYNYIYYIIGVYFGMINYVLQKGLTSPECEKQYKKYMIPMVKMLKYLRTKFKVILSFLGYFFFLIVILLSYLSTIYLYIVLSSQDNVSDIILNYEKSTILSIFLLLDTDVLVLLIHLMALFMYIRGENFINDLLTHPFFTPFSRIYFSYILLINPILFYIIYDSETSIPTDYSYIFLFSLISIIIIFTISSFVYVSFEVPYKRLIKHIIKPDKLNPINTDINATYSISQIENSNIIDDSYENNNEETEDIIKNIE